MKTLPFLLGFFLFASPVYALVSITELQKQAIDQAFADQDPATASWNYPSHLGLHYTSQYALILKAFESSDILHKFSVKTRFSESDWKEKVVSAQLPDGAWATLPKGTEGDLNASIYHYWALKASGVSPREEFMIRASRWVVANGGIEKSNLFTKLFLALFGEYSWEAIPEIPYLLFVDRMPSNVRSFAQWIGPHLRPIAYLRAHQVVKTLGSGFKIDELWSNPISLRKWRAQAPLKRMTKSHLISLDTPHIEKLISLQRPRGSFGGYTTATLFSMLALEHYENSVPSAHSKTSPALQRGFQFVESMYFQNCSTCAESTMNGITDDGHYWDTALMGIALADAGVPLERLRPSAQYLVDHQTENGGLPFGIDFEYAPDTDDTAEMLLFLSRFGNEFNSAIRRGLGFIKSMQNKDGGWGAFDRNNAGNALLRALAKPFEDSADLFDESSADVTGHILESLGALGYGESDPTVAHALAYLKTTQDPLSGTWEGRWGVNRIYATSAVIVGALKVGVSVHSGWIQKAVNWLIDTQKRDAGCWGESVRSYEDRTHWGQGLCTASQTAWAVIALRAAADQALQPDDRITQALFRGANHLVNTYSEKERTWKDAATVGTGHPRVVYMDYPSYPKIFPLMAIFRVFTFLKAD